MKAKPVYKGSPLYARSTMPTFFTLSCFLGAVTLTSLSLLSSSLVHAGARWCTLVLQIYATANSNLQTAHANARIPVVATTANPSPQDVACPAEKRTRSRPADIKETFYRRELRNDVYTRRLSDFYERKSDIASTILTRFITAH